MPAAPNVTNISTYNGSGKKNYANVPPASLITAFDNPSLATALGDTSSMLQTAVRWMCRFQPAATTGAIVLLSSWAQWGNVSSSLPTSFVRNGSTGSFTITLPTMVDSEYQASIGNHLTETVNLSQPVGASYEGTVYGFINVNCSANVINIQLADHTGTASDMVGQNVWLSVR